MHFTGLQMRKTSNKKLNLAELKKTVKENSNEKEKEKIYEFYLKNLKYVNNWDLVDLSAEKNIGGFLIGKERKILFELAKGNLWEKRIAVMSTFNFIKKNDLGTTLKISKLLLKDKH